MSTKDVSLPVVPSEVQHLVDDHVCETAERWQSYSLSDVQKMMPETTVISAGEQLVHAAVLLPKGDFDNNEALVISAPHQNGWAPSIYIRSEITRQIVAPDAMAIVFPNNGGKDRYYQLTDQQIADLNKGNLAPIAEMRVRVLEALHVGEIAATGFSLGANLAVAMAAVGSDKVEVIAINADEAPSELGRTNKQLRKDAMKSNSWGEQREAIADANIPALSEYFTRLNMARDYAGFALATLRRANKAVEQAMSGSIQPQIGRALEQYPNLPIKIGSIIGSLLTNDGDIHGTRIRHYSGEATHRHATGDNPFAHALMAKDGVGAF